MKAVTIFGLIAWGCFQFTAHARDGYLLYLGLTDNGWQVFRLDMETGESAQLTYSPGDKKYPQYHDGLDTVVFRDSVGYVNKINGEKEERVNDNWGRCARFVLSRDGETLIFAWWSTGNPNRHRLWRQGKNEAKPTLVHRPPTGSYSYLALSPDGQNIVATRIMSVREERLVLIPLAHPDRAEYITGKTSSATLPSWSSDGQRVLFARGTGGKNYDLYELEVATRKLSPVLVTEGAVELRPVEDGDGKYVFFEQRSERDVGLAFLDRRSGVVEELDVGRQAKEPHWYD